MKYKIINTDLFINGKLIPEGEIISLDSPDESIKNYLQLIDNSLPITDYSSLITENLALSEVEGSKKNLKQNRKVKSKVSPFTSHGDKK